MPVYCFKHPVSGEIFEIKRSMSQSAEPFVSDDGHVCLRDINAEHSEGDRAHSGVNHKTAEPWNVDSDYIRKSNPKFLKTRDGTKLTRDQYYKYLK